MIVVIGASAAGLTAAETLRREGYDGPLTIVGAESHSPYDRPPLSKEVLRGTWSPDRVTLRKDEALAALGAEWLLGRRATGLDLGTRQVSLADGAVLSYDGLVIATGVVPRTMPQGHELDGVHVLRSVDDAMALRENLSRARRLVVIGAGFLGAEAAAVACELGLEVTLVHPQGTPMVRQLGALVGGLLAELHAGHGVTTRCGAKAIELVGGHGRLTGVRLEDGTLVPADVALVAIGSRPAVDWLASSGLRVGDGVECDEFCQAAPGVVAAGDVASWPHPEHGRLRLEHRMNATEQGMAAAKTLLGNGTPFAPVPYFWTDQYDVKIQVHGVVPVGGKARIVAGNATEGRFAALCGTDDRVTAVLTWNLPRQARTLRPLAVARTPWHAVDAELAKGL